MEYLIDFRLTAELTNGETIASEVSSLGYVAAFDDFLSLNNLSEDDIEDYDIERLTELFPFFVYFDASDLRLYMHAIDESHARHMVNQNPAFAGERFVVLDAEMNEKRFS